MQEAIITEKCNLLQSLTTKENFIKITKEIMMPLWNNHSEESFNFICNELDKNITLLNN